MPGFPVNLEGTWVGNVSNPVTLDNGELRRADAGLFAGDGTALGARGGIVRHGDSSLAVTVDGSDNVTIQPGAVAIPGLTGQGVYRAALGAATTQAMPARNATNPRIDLVIFQQLDTDALASAPGYTSRITTVSGTASATPSAPALPSMAVELARVTLPATGGGAATVDSSFRTFAAAAGATIPVTTFARLPASAAKWQRAQAIDTGREYVWNGTAWVAVPVTQAGTKTLAVAATNNTYFASVTFPTPFAGVPVVQLTPNVSSPATVSVAVQASGLTTTGFGIAYSRTTGTDFDCFWTATLP